MYNNSYRPQNIFSSITPVVKNLIIINVLIFLATWIAQEQGYFLIGEFGFYYFDSPNFKPYQIITAMFLHGDPMHLLSNMLGLFIFGPVVEEIWGAKRFLLYYVLCGLGGFALITVIDAAQLFAAVGSLTIDPNGLFPVEIIPQLKKVYGKVGFGASGALFGIMVAFGYMFPNREMFSLFLPIPIKAKYFVFGYALLELLRGFADNPNDNVSHFGHLGGALAGIILLTIFRRQGKLWSR